MKNLGLLICGVVVAVFGALLAAVPASQAVVGDRDCADFSSQKAAQIFYLKHGGPRSDPHRLDADNDGTACDSNPCPCYRGTRLPGSGPVSTPPKRVDTVVKLALSRDSAIEGEPTKLRVRVLPRMTREVKVQRRTASGWKRIGAARTSSNGRHA